MERAVLHLDCRLRSKGKKPHLYVQCFVLSPSGCRSRTPKPSPLWHVSLYNLAAMELLRLRKAQTCVRQCSARLEDPSSVSCQVRKLEAQMPLLAYLLGQHTLYCSDENSGRPSVSLFQSRQLAYRLCPGLPQHCTAPVSASKASMLTGSA